MSNSSSDSFAKIVVYLAVGIVSLLAFCAGNCGEPDPKLERALKSQGLTDVQVGEWDAFECSGSDSISRAFTAKNSSGARVHGTICCGYFVKGCTVRW